MIGHLGTRVSALLDGQMSPEEEDRAWSHVHGCHECRDQVEREGWVKTRLAGLSFDHAPVPGHLSNHIKGSLLAVTVGMPVTPGDTFLMAPAPDPRPRRVGLVALGGSAAGAAVMGVLALGAAPAQAPTITPRTPLTQVTNQSPVSVVTPHRRQFLP